MVVAVVVKVAVAVAVVVVVVVVVVVIAVAVVVVEEDKEEKIQVIDVETLGVDDLPTAFAETVLITLTLLQGTTTPITLTLTLQE